jgi:eukaryotic-like serine/threonine-protein kinase
MAPQALFCSSCGSRMSDAADRCGQCGTRTDTPDTPTSAPTAAGVEVSRVDPTFGGTARFRLDRKLGAGGMGVVFAAFDAQRREHVALKTLFNTSPEAISRLKREFRVLADVTHPNLVGLYELIADRHECFYTMELIEGVDFLRAVRGRELDTPRLIHVLAQLAEGVMAIHHAGKLHRDLKPSNVLVTRASRAVVLDFGIAAELQTLQAQATIDEGFVGTVAYMAPEQVTGRAQTASDWYSVGVMLYQALTGRLPYAGSPLEILADKAGKDPEPPDALDPDLPPNLVALSMALLARDAGSRPDGGDVLARLGRGRRRGWAAGASVVSRSAVIGREAQIRLLDEALGAVRPGHAVVACVHGSSGSGKTALTQWFTRHHLGAGALLLQSRCYVRESVPYKALDGIVEQLAWHLQALPAKDRRRRVPRHMSALAHVFPVLKTIADEHAEDLAAPGGLDPIQVRREAFEALRELLRRLSADRPLVLVVDDLQWGDAESALALEELLRRPDQPGALVIASFRTDDITVEPFVQSLVDRARRGDPSLDVREIELGPLSDDHSRGLAASLIAAGPAARAAIDGIVKEAQGVPFLVELLSRYVSTAPDIPHRSAITLDDVIASALRDLPDGCRHVLEAVIVAGRPIDTMVVRDAADVDGDERRLVGALQGAYLLRPAGSAATVEPYHDRIRDALVRRLSAERLAEIHLNLARAMEARGIDEPETLSEHYLEGGERGLAATHAARAAVAASRQLAFERAATLYRRALELSPEGADRAAWHVGLADALAHAGRGVQAARAYLSAAEIPGVDPAAMHRAAADHLLRCGHIQEGLVVVDKLVAAAALGRPRSRPVTIARVIMRRIRLRLKDWRFTERSAADIDPARLMRIDAGTTLGAGLARVDGLRAADYHAFAALLALEAGEPVRVARCMLGETAFGCLAGGGTLQATQNLLARAARLAERLDHPHVTAMVHLVRCMLFAHAGQFASARPEAERAEHILRRQCVDVWRDIDLAQAYTFLSLYYLGELAELGRLVPRRLQEASDHDDRYAAADAIGRPNIVWLVRDDVSGARDALANIRQPDAAHRLDWPDYLRLFAETQVDLYADSPMTAWQRIEEGSSALAPTTITRVQSARIEARHLRARCALAAAREAPDAKPLLEAAERVVRRLRREKVAWADAFADLIAAAAADHRRESAALALTARALARLEACGLPLYAAAARRRYGALLGGSDGQQAINAADAWMHRQGVVSPARMTALLAPGFRA